MRISTLAAGEYLGVHRSWVVRRCSSLGQLARNGKNLGLPIPSRSYAALRGHHMSGRECMKPNAKQKKWVMSLVGVLKEVYALQAWEIEVVYNDGSGVSNTPGHDVTAEIDVSPDYMTAHIRLFPIFWEQEQWKREDILTHEFAHILIQPYRRIWERQANYAMVTKEEEHGVNELLATQIERLAVDYVRKKKR